MAVFYTLCEEQHTVLTTELFLFSSGLVLCLWAGVNFPRFVVPKNNWEPEQGRDEIWDISVNHSGTGRSRQGRGVRGFAVGLTLCPSLVGMCHSDPDRGGLEFGDV